MWRSIFGGVESNSEGVESFCCVETHFGCVETTHFQRVFRPILEMLKPMLLVCVPQEFITVLGSIRIQLSEVTLSEVFEDELPRKQLPGTMSLIKKYSAVSSLLNTPHAVCAVLPVSN